MLASAQPVFFNIPFANGADASHKRAIPQGSQIGVTGGAASLTDGFPPLNFLPISAGGIPPFGQDVNGILNEISASVQWLQAGGLSKYNAAFSAGIGGYPNGAVLLNASGTGFWVSIADNNTSNPDVGGANWKWMAANYLDKSVTGNVNVVLTNAETSYEIIDFMGILTGNITVTVPSAANRWVIKNTTTGAFTITLKLATSSGVVVQQGTSSAMFTDGTTEVEFAEQTGNTATPGDNSKLLATTAFVKKALTDAMAALVPTGIISLWSGAVANIPSGWVLCDGTSPTPDLRDKFIIGASATHTPNATGGSADAIVVSHNHAASSSSSSSFSGSALGAHGHGVSDPGHTHSTNALAVASYGGSGYYYQQQQMVGATINAAVTGISIQTASAGTPAGSVSTSTTTTNTAAGSSGTNANLPPYYALAYIYKL